MRAMYVIRSTTIAAVALFLAACGGGGSQPTVSVAPTVTATDPLPTANGASLLRVTATFSEALDPATVTINTFKLAGPSGSVSGTVSLSGNTMIFTPTTPLDFATDYTATLTTAIRDVAGNPLAAEQVWTFNTGAKIVAGGFSTCTRFANGAVKCWGGNERGELGQGSLDIILGDGPDEMGDNLSPIDLGTGRTVVEIAFGEHHSCARLDDGTVKCWGENQFGQLGQGHNNDIGDAPNEMGDNLSPIDLGTSRRAVQIAAGNNHTCARLTDGSVKCWGDNLYGQLGQGHGNVVGDNPNEMGDNLSPIDLGTNRTAVGIAVGYDHSCARLDDGTLKCWGSNDLGELGLGHTNRLGDGPGEMGDSLPAIDLGTNRQAVEVAGGRHFTCARLDNGTMKCWGGNIVGQLGQGHTLILGNQPGEMGDTLLPINVGSNRTVVQISAGRSQACARLDDGATKCWGNNRSGQLGQGHASNLGDAAGEMGDNLAPINFGASLSASHVTAGSTHTCAHLDNGAIKCWGVGDVLGLGIAGTNLGDGPDEMGDALPTVDLGAPR